MVFQTAPTPPPTTTPLIFPLPQRMPPEIEQWRLPFDARHIFFVPLIKLALVSSLIQRDDRAIFAPANHLNYPLNASPPPPQAPKIDPCFSLPGFRASINCGAIPLHPFTSTFGCINKYAISVRRHPHKPYNK